ncbi:MAG: aminomethyl-transferring glycine dehydrogenase subunit GcvPB [Deltaproteobacteria bacterium]
MSDDRYFPKSSPGTQGLLLAEPLLFERGVRGRTGASLPPAGVDEANPENEIPRELLRGEIEGLPELSEPEVMRHFVRISQWNYGIDSGPFPLGSCTMKYNPKSSEAIARLSGFARLHPMLPDEDCQGALQLAFELERALSEIAGFSATSLEPAAGAQGELCGLLMIRAYHQARGNPRKKVLIPDTAHGTNPATCTLAGYDVVPLPSGRGGVLEAATVAAALDDEVAALMVTNPNTLGIFERNVREIAGLLHDKGALLYNDGANLNALIGVARPGDMGVDVMHYNLHKTFATPHGGGGPGSGPVGVSEALVPFLPTPTVKKSLGDDGAPRYALDFDRPQSIGRLRTFWGNFGMWVRAYALIREWGPEGVRRTAQLAVLNANYLRTLLAGSYHVPFPEATLHEVVFSDKRQKEHGVSAIDVAKRLIDHGFHPPTVYFPLVVPGALMIEPTETESPEAVEALAAALNAIALEAVERPEALHEAPTRTIVGRLDEVRAARQPVLRWKPLNG